MTPELCVITYAAHFSHNFGEIRFLDKFVGPILTAATLTDRKSRALWSIEQIRLENDGTQ